jgi:hypothetical protein
MDYKKIEDTTKIEKNKYRLKAKVKEMGNVISIRHVSTRPGATIRILPGGEQYVKLSDGSVHDIKHAETRKDNIKSVRETIGRLRDIINTNCVDPNSVKWLTLTYADNMTDTERLAKDFKDFIRKLRADYKGFEYIAVAEPQGRGAWHMHVILIFDKKAPFIDNETIWKKYWRERGFTKTKAVDKNCDNLGAYFSVYLTDIKLEDIPENTEIEDPEVIQRTIDGEKKNVVKGGRLHMYPTGFNFYRCSRGIKKPEVSEMTLAEAEELTKDYAEVYSTAYTLEDEKSGYNLVVYEKQFNKVRQVGSKPNL